MLSAPTTRIQPLNDMPRGRELYDGAREDERAFAELRRSIRLTQMVLEGEGV